MSLDNTGTTEGIYSAVAELDNHTLKVPSR